MKHPSPGCACDEEVAPLIPVAAEKDGVVAEMPLGGDSRTWLLGTPLREGSLAPLAGKDLRIAPLPQRYLIKYGDFPLDVVKDYVLDWPGDHDNYPRLFVGNGGASSTKRFTSAIFCTDSQPRRR